MNHRALDGAKGEIVMYQLDDIVKLDVRLENESVWLNRQQIALLFDRDVKTIGKHINNALREELKDMSTVAIFAIVQKSIQAFTPCPTDRLTFGFCSTRRIACSTTSCMGHGPICKKKSLRIKRGLFFMP